MRSARSLRIATVVGSPQPDDLLRLRQTGIDFHHIARKPLPDGQQAFLVGGLIVMSASDEVGEGIRPQAPAEMEAVSTVCHQWVGTQYAADPFARLICYPTQRISILFACIHADAINLLVSAVNVYKEADVMRYILSFVCGASGAERLKVDIDIRYCMVLVESLGKLRCLIDARKSILYHLVAANAEMRHDDRVSFVEKQREGVVDFAWCFGRCCWNCGLDVDEFGGLRNHVRAP